MVLYPYHSSVLALPYLVTLWPSLALQVWMWYLSVTLLVIMVTFLTIRCLLFFFAWIAGYEFWVLPRLFDETLAFAESFTPVRGCQPQERSYATRTPIKASAAEYRAVYGRRVECRDCWVVGVSSCAPLLPSLCLCGRVCRRHATHSRAISWRGWFALVAGTKLTSSYKCRGCVSPWSHVVETPVGMLRSCGDLIRQILLQ